MRSQEADAKHSIFTIKFALTFLTFLEYKVDVFVRKRPGLMIFFSVISAIIIFSISFPYNLSAFIIKISTEINEIIGIANIYDNSIKSVISGVIGSLTVVVSLFFAIYVFTYREQKSVSPSASADNIRNTMVLYGLCSLIFTVVYGFLIVNHYSAMSQQGNNNSLEITKQLSSRLALLSAVVFLLILLLIKLIVYLFRRMSVDSMLTDSVGITNHLLRQISYFHRSPLFNQLLEEKYKEFQYSLESVFQNLRFAADHNMNKEFEENIIQFREFVDELKGDTCKEGSQKVYKYLLKEDKEKFLASYKSALRSNLSLISNLLNGNHYNKAQDLVSLHFYMYIGEPALQKVFQSSLNEFLDTIDTINERQLQIFINGLKQIPNQQTLLTYKFLIMRMINKDGLKPLTNVVYEVEKYSDDSILKRSIIIIFLQNLIKSIEVANYQITGFFVKFLITNFTGKELDRGLLILKLNRTLFTSVTEAEEDIEGVDDYPVNAFQLNDETYDYCYKKAYLLLHGQHVFSFRYNLWYTEKRTEIDGEIPLAREFNQCLYCDYMVKKTQQASKLYGLLFFDDEYVMGKIYKELNLKSQKDEKEIGVTRSIRVLVDKFFKQ